MSRKATKVHIRRATIKDAQKISYLIRKNVDKVKENKYSLEQLKAWKKDNTLTAIKNKFEERIIFSAFQNEKLIGTIGLKDNYLVGLYISFSKRGLGLGKDLLVFLEHYAIKEGIKELQLTATPNGYGFYLKNGYEPQGKIDLFYYGIKFVETKMKKQLK